MIPKEQILQIDKLSKIDREPVEIKPEKLKMRHTVRFGTA